MAVSDDQVAALRAHLADEAERLNRRLAEVGDLDGYGELVWAAFVLAVRHRFAPEWTVPQIVKYAAAARAAWGKDADEIAQHAAETMLRRALDHNVSADLDELAKGRAQVFLLSELIADEQFDNTQVDELLAKARVLADNWLSTYDR